MRSNLVVVSTPFLLFLAGVVKAQKPVLVQALGRELAVERLDVRIFGGLAGLEEVQEHMSLRSRSREMNSLPLSTRIIFG